MPCEGTHWAHNHGEVQMERVRIAQRELTPFEQLILGLVCEGQTNSSIAHATSHTEKVVENTVSRAAKAFSIKSDVNTNTRILLALAFRAHYGDRALEKLGVECQHLEIDADGKSICHRHD